MRMFSSLSAFLRTVLSFLLPFRRVLCDARVPPGAAWPLCAACEAALLNAADDGLHATRCTSCGKPIISEKGRCMRCRTHAYSFDSAYPLFRYDGDARNLILAYKSKKRRSLALFLALLIARGIEEKYPGRIVVPVPPRSGKKRRKGWDQVEDIARILESRHGVTVSRVLGRRDGLEQKSLNLEERKLNMAGTIFMRKGLIAPGQPVLLDDVLTTGATLSECAAILKAGGANRVDACVIAAD